MNFLEDMFHYLLVTFWSVNGFWLRIIFPYKLFSAYNYCHNKKFNVYDSPSSFMSSFLMNKKVNYVFYERSPQLILSKVALRLYKSTLKKMLYFNCIITPTGDMKHHQKIEQSAISSIVFKFWIFLNP